MASITFYLQSKKSPSGIYVRLRDGMAVDAKAKTKYSINPSDWSAAKGQPKNLKDENFKKLNEDLKVKEKELLAHYNSSVGKAMITTEWLKEFINPAPKEVQITEKLLEYFDYYISCKGNELTSSSVKKLNVVKSLLKRFEAETRIEYLIKNVDLNFKLSFEAYCVKYGYAPNTISRAIIFVKSICFHARSNGILTNFQLDNIKVKYHKATKIYLTPDELKKIENKKFEAEHLTNVRDWLLISCETGQRVSDFLRFTKDKIVVENEKHFIEFTQQKTGKLMKIPLSKNVLAILKKRKGKFPIELSEQKYNDYVKEVCELAGLTQKIKGSRKDPETNRKETGTFEKWQLISSHVGRRSFATNNYGRVPTSILKYMTGHSTEKMFLEYIGKTQTETALQAAEYF